VELRRIWSKASDGLSEKIELERAVKEKLHSQTVRGEIQLAKSTMMRRLV
jgi:hypothetical protein